MSGMMLSFFLSVILLIRLLPLSSLSNIIITVIAGILFILLGLSEASEKAGGLI